MLLTGADPVEEISSGLVRLNLATRQWHASVDDGWLSLLRPTVTVAEYVGQLVRTYGLVAPFESACRYTPVDHRWKAVGAGFGVAWPMTDSARLFGMVEFAVPVSRNTVTLDGYGTYEPDPLTARSSVGLEVGWR